MPDLYEELASVIDALERQRIEYAICDGIAMAVWDVARATVDIDLLVEERDLNASKPLSHHSATLMRPCQCVSPAVRSTSGACPRPTRNQAMYS